MYIYMGIHTQMLTDDTVARPTGGTHALLTRMLSCSSRASHYSPGRFRAVIPRHTRILAS